MCGTNIVVKANSEVRLGHHCQVFWPLTEWSLSLIAWTNKSLQALWREYLRPPFISSSHTSLLLHMILWHLLQTLPRSRSETKCLGHSIAFICLSSKKKVLNEHQRNEHQGSATDIGLVFAQNSAQLCEGRRWRGEKTSSLETLDDLYRLGPHRHTVWSFPRDGVPRWWHSGPVIGIVVASRDANRKLPVSANGFELIPGKAIGQNAGAPSASEFPYRRLSQAMR